MHHPGEHYAPPVVNTMHPNNTVIKKTNLNNVNRAGGKDDVEKSVEIIEEKNAEEMEDINDIRRKIKESLEDKGKYNLTNPDNSVNERELLESHAHLKVSYSENSEVKNNPRLKRYISKKKEELAREVAEELNDDHSLGAFRMVAYKIPEQKIRIFLSIIKDTYLTGKIKKSRGAMFISLAKVYAVKNNINLDFK